MSQIIRWAVSPSVFVTLTARILSFQFVIAGSRSVSPLACPARVARVVPAVQVESEQAALVESEQVALVESEQAAPVVYLLQMPEWAPRPLGRAAIAQRVVPPLRGCRG